MADKYTKEEFMQKCQWEGGRLHEGFEYGLTAKHIKGNAEFKESVARCHDAFLVYQAVLEEHYEEFAEDWEATEYEQEE